jgi:AraC-like DNA-binding protein
MHEVRAVALTGFPEAARLVGLDPHQLLGEMALTPAMLADPENRVSASAAINLVEKAAEQSQCDSFGLLMVSSRTFASLGPIALLLERLHTVDDVVLALRDYRRHINDLLTVDIGRSTDTAIIKIGLADMSKRQAVDIAMGATYLALSGASGGRWTAECVHFSHDAPRDLTPWKRLFRAPLEFRSSFTGFSCTTAALGIGNPLANAEMARHARRLLDLVPLPPVDERVAERVRRNILLLLPEGQATVHAVAKTMGVSARTLQRQLDGEGKAFGELLHEVRLEVVQRYLSGSTQTMSSIAEMAGYNSVGSFSRWFSAQFGMAPTDWRAAQRKIAEGPPPTWRV